MSDTTLDVITIGRCSVDLYGEQVGGPLEDMASFAKYVGGSPTNMAIGTAKLGLKSAVITGVGDEHMGRFVREELERHGVETRGREDRRRAADRARHPRHPRQAHLPADLLPRELRRQRAHRGRHRRGPGARARAVVVTGTHFSRPNLDAMSRKAIRLAKAKGRRVGLDIDYRPVLWGLTGHGLGEERFVSSEAVSAHLQTILPACDLIVGTEEEVHIAGGTTDTLAAIRKIRELAPRR